MITVKICKDVKSAETKLIFNLTGRQLICSLMAAALSIGAFLLLKPFLGLEPLFVVITILCVPFIAVGFFKVYGLPFDKFMKIFWFYNIKAASNRKYKSENFYTIKDRHIHTADELDEAETEGIIIETEDDKKKKPKKKKSKKSKYKKSKLAIK